MSSYFTWRRWTVIVSALVIISLGIGAALIFEQGHHSMTASGVKVFDTRLKILWAKMQKGSNAWYLPADGVLASNGRLGSTLEGEVRWGIRRLGIDIQTLPAFTPGTNARGRAFLVGYSFSVPRPPSEQLVAEVIAEDGTLYPLLSAAGGGEGPPERSWNIWTLSSLPVEVTNYHLRLRLGTNGVPVAEIRFPEF